MDALSPSEVKVEMRAGDDLVSKHTGAMSASLVAVALAALALLMRWRGADWPAQLYRVDLFERVGFTQWDNQWYGGHHTPGYSILFPPLGAIFGTGIVAVASAFVATYAFALLVRERVPAPRLAAVTFGAGTLTNIAIGRLTFALGLAIGLVAAVAMTNAWKARSALFAVATSFASPVAGVFLVLAGSAWALARRPWRRLGLAVALAAAVPILVLAFTFPEGGRFPYGLDDASISATVGLLAVLLAPRELRALRIGGALYALAAVATLLTPNPLGANITRLGMYLGPPLVLGVLWPARARLAAALTVPLLLWTWAPAFDGFALAGRDPSSEPGYYRGLLAELKSLPPSRIEIPFTKRHWESLYVARHAALARGWERQLDIGINPIFYDSTVALTAQSYLAWLDSRAVQYVALPDAELDASALREAELLRAGVPGLEPIWQDQHWRLWRVSGARPLVEGAASLVDLDADSFTLKVDAPGDVLVRINYSSHWDVDGPGCAVPDESGWTVIRFPKVGTWRVRQVVSRWTPFTPEQNPGSCPSNPP